ncbi:MAG: D-alanyl-D-alanine carboxypeptidase [Defluviitaleaceae bacterium]|nr:D-alanyl-D-alanine carboxypeptidase [Defluviitaleaceae bacterium]
MKQKKIILLILITILIGAFPNTAFANEAYLGLTARSAILIEERSGRILYEKNAHERIYPASTTKVLTAYLALDFLDPDELIVLGREILLVPPGSSVARHQVGETITVENMIRALIISSGNETSISVAVNVVRRTSGVNNINYSDAMDEFMDMMNERARSIGALNTNFTNPHGFHDDNHFTTAYDMALIIRAALQNPLIRQIAAESTFVGNGADNRAAPGAITQNYDWTSRNLLIVEGSPFYYPYATGFKTGFTDQASDTLATSASRDNINLIAAVFYSPMPGRWNDSTRLFEFGFNFFGFELVQEAEVILGQVEVDGVRLGYDNLLDIVSNLRHTEFLSRAEVGRLRYEIIFDNDLISPQEEGVRRSVRLMAPIEEGQPLGRIVYTIDGNVIYEDTIFAAYEIYGRTPQTDRAYRLGEFRERLFSLSGLIYWIGFVIIILLIFFIVLLITGRRRSRGYSIRSRRY